MAENVYIYVWPRISFMFIIDVTDHLRYVSSRLRLAHSNFCRRECDKVLCRLSGPVGAVIWKSEQFSKAAG